MNAHDTIVFAAIFVFYMAIGVALYFTFRAKSKAQRQLNRATVKAENAQPYRVQAFMTKIITGGDEVPYEPTYCLGQKAADTQYQALRNSAPPGHFRIEIIPVTMEEYLEKAGSSA